MIELSDLDNKKYFHHVQGKIGNNIHLFIYFNIIW